MTRSYFLSRFTPSLLSPETLEAIFVQRESLAQRIVDVVHESCTTDSRHYLLVLGPRGSGKTHLVSLIYYRLRDDPDVSDRMLTAWLREEEWGVASYLDLLLSLLRALGESGDVEGVKEATAPLYGEGPSKAEAGAEKLLLELIGDRTLLVIAENLDEIFRGLEREGQEKLRALIQNHPRFAILATTQSLFPGVSHRNFPFHGFFEVHHLKELSFDGAVDLVSRIAKHEGDEELEAEIRKVEGRARLRAVHHLAAGNPRVYVIFSQFLTRESLDELVEPLLQTLDDLTPYYQSRMAALTPQQRKIVEFLCDQRHAVKVAEIASHCFVTHQTASAQLKKLREKGFARSTALGRESYYELREPLMRLSMEVKKLRGRPIRLFVDFLRLWYSRRELSRRLTLLSDQLTAEREYLEEALAAGAERDLEPAVAACMEEYGRFREAGEVERALEVSEELIALRGSAWDYEWKGGCLLDLGRFDEALDAYAESTDIDSSLVAARTGVIRCMSRMRRAEDALVETDRALAEFPDERILHTARGAVLWQLGEYDAAEAANRRAVEMDPNALGAHSGLIHTLVDRRRFRSAHRALDVALKHLPRNPSLLVMRATALDAETRYEEALRVFQAARKLDPENGELHGEEAISLYRLGRLEESLAALERSVELLPPGVKAMACGANRAVALHSLGDLHGALDQYRRLPPEYTDNFHDRSNLAVLQMDLGRADECRKILRVAARSPHSLLSDDLGEVAVVRNLLIRTRDRSEWRKHIPVWIEIFEEEAVLETLGQGLVRGIATLIIPWITDEDARAWHDTWAELTEGHDEFIVPLRLLYAAVEYRATKDERVLLGLPAEERRLLRTILPYDLRPARWREEDAYYSPDQDGTTSSR